MGSRNLWYRLGEDLSRTSLVTASKAPNFQPQFHRTPLPRQVFQTAKIGAMTAPGQFAARWTTRGLLNMNIDQEPAVNPLSLIEYQLLSWQYRLRMARGRCHCKLSLKQYDHEMFGDILKRHELHRKCGRSHFYFALTLFQPPCR